MAWSTGTTETPEQNQSIRVEMLEVYEGSDTDAFPLFVTSDAAAVGQHRREYPNDTVVRRYWVREGGMG